MERLTKKFDIEQALRNFPKGEAPTSVLKDIKLSQLEDIEEELGCPLEVVFKAMKDGVWSVRYGIYQHSKINRFIFMNDNCYLVVDDSYYDTKDYKKTWRL